MLKFSSKNQQQNTNSHPQRNQKSSTEKSPVHHPRSYNVHPSNEQKIERKTHSTRKLEVEDEHENGVAVADKLIIINESLAIENAINLDTEFD